MATAKQMTFREKVNAFKQSKQAGVRLKSDEALVSLVEMIQVYQRGDSHITLVDTHPVYHIVGKPIYRQPA